MAKFIAPRRRTDLKVTLKSWLEYHLYGEIKNTQHQEMLELVNRNNRVIGAAHRHVKYRGTLYNFEQDPPKAPYNYVAPQLEGAFLDYYRRHVEVLGIELPIVMGFVTAVLNASENPLFYYEVLPAQLHKTLYEKTARFPLVHQLPSEEARDALLIKHASPLQQLKQRLLLNLLTEP